MYCTNTDCEFFSPRKDRYGRTEFFCMFRKYHGEKTRSRIRPECWNRAINVLRLKACPKPVDWDSIK